MIHNKYNKQFSMSLIQCHGGIKELAVVGGNAARSEGGQSGGHDKMKNNYKAEEYLYVQPITMAIHKYRENGGRDRFLPRQVGIPD